MYQTIQINHLIRSRRRSIGLEISDKGELIVRAPLRASIRAIEDVVREKQAWIIRHQQDVQHKVQKHEPKKFLAGENFLYLGRYYPLKMTDKVSPLFYFDNAFYLSFVKIEKARDLFFKWYWQQAEKIVAERVSEYAAQHGFFYQKIKINNPKRQWGSCSPDGKLSFTWRLIMAPLEVLDYVVVHELVHTYHKNHSKRYWQKVQSIMPNYKEHKKWLKENDCLLTI